MKGLPQVDSRMNRNTKQEVSSAQEPALTRGGNNVDPAEHVDARLLSLDELAWVAGGPSIQNDPT